MIACHGLLFLSAAVIVSTPAQGFSLASRCCSRPAAATRLRLQLFSDSIDDAPTPAAMSRREALVSAAAATASPFLIPLSSNALSTSGTSILIEGPEERQDLLRAINSRAPESTVADLISRLEPLDPSKGSGAAAPELGGTWKLVYSVNAEAFSPLLNLPAPIRPTSLQLLGDDASREVGEGRVAQVLNFLLIPLSLVLSSGAVPVQNRLTTLEISPPFRLEAVWGDGNLRRPGRTAGGQPEGGTRWRIVDSGSDAEFRALNARDGEAQAAGRNMYKQRYLEVTGRPGDLRISEVVSGDPVIVGAVFVHQRL